MFLKTCCSIREYYHLTVDKEILHKCPWCDVTKSLRGLACHASKTHKQPASELHKMVLHGGVVPLCACGCGKPVKWLQKKYGEYLRGHNGFTETARANAADAIKIAAATDRAEISRRLAARTDEEKKRHYTNISKAQIGRRSWNSGLTKKDHEGSRTAAEKISEIKQVYDARPLTTNEFASRICEFTKFEVLSSAEDCRNEYHELSFKCKSCGLIQDKSLAMLSRRPDFCPKCSPKESKGQLELYEFVRSLCPEALLSDKTVPGVSEIDVHVPSKRFGVEYNGLYWHSEPCGKGSMYHQDKTDACNSRGISLFHVYEDDWRFRRTIVESMVRYRLGMASARVFARKCSVVEVSVGQRRDFFERCHIDGDTSSKIAFGLRYGGRIVAVLSLRKPFHAKWKNYAEIGRFATELDTVVVGGLSRLVKVASGWAKEKEYSGLLSYVDGRVGEGNGYVSAGLRPVGKTSSMFWWTDYERRYNRFQFRADSARGLTERQVAEEAGVVKIYGCKNHVMLMDVC